MDNGSSQSQATVHAEVADEIAEADADMLKDVVNDSLLPFLVKHGFPVQGYEFDWDLTYEYTPEEIQATEEMLLGHFEIDPRYFEEKYNIPVKVAKQQVQLVKEKKKPLRLVNSPAPHEPDCGCGGHDNLLTFASGETKAETASAELIRFIWDNRKADYSYEYFHWLSDIYLRAVDSGWKGNEKLKLAGVKTAYEPLDNLTRQLFDLNIFRFASAKASAAAIELNTLAKKADTFNNFRKEAEKVTSLYNEDYLRTEYNFAWNTSHNAAQYYRMLDVKEQYPTWQYVTAGDDRVRPAHKVLNGMKFAAGDPAFDSIYPPNGWGCRCYVKAIKGVPEKYSTKADAENALAGSSVDSKGNSEWDRMVKGRFNKNRAKIGTIYEESHFYIKEELGGKLSWKSQGLNSFDEIMATELPEAILRERDFEFSKAWLKNKGNMLTDYSGRKLEFSENTLSTHNKADRLKIVELTPDIIGSPDEVYLFYDGEKKKFKLRYIKFYKGKALNVVADVKESGFKLESWYDLKTQVVDSHARNGILIKKAIA